MVRRGTCSGDLPTSACSSASSGRRPSIVTVTQVPGTGSSWREVNSPEGSGTSTMPSSAISKQPTSSAGPNRFLVRPDQPEAGVPVALERQHHVHQVLQQPRPGDVPVLGDVTDDDHRHAALLGHPDQRAGHLADLGDAAGGAVGLGRADGLHRVDHQQRRAGPPRCGRARCRGRSRRPGRARRPARRSARPAAGPGRRTPRPSRTGCVRPAFAHCAATSSSSVDLPTPGSPASSTTAPGTRPSPSTRSSSPTPVRTRAAASASTSLIRVGPPASGRRP